MSDLPKPTIHSVAHEAGVSTMTVSRFLRNADGVRDGTRCRVQAVIDRLAYKPDPAAQALRSRPSHQSRMLRSCFPENGERTNASRGTAHPRGSVRMTEWPPRSAPTARSTAT
ncbi:LacI family DNA-binding transcriptional regulator [Curtobacterium flaccumfaciens pv. flaccumfaciens]|uniref:LacI family DNA-binding transcriptional regulator n=1 Tax=Curtobacterium flaccumfaciens TaxID=2035 RepID=UPI003A4DF894